VIVWLIILGSIAATLAYGGLYAYWGEVKDWFRSNKSHGASFKGANPKEPPWTEKEIAAFGKWFSSLALPGIVLSVAKKPIGADGTRIGGPLFLREGEHWPQDTAGEPLEFVAQLDFARLPALPDYPERGLLQFFVRREGSFGYDGNDALHREPYCRWLSDGATEAGRLEAPPPLGARDKTPFLPTMHPGGKAARTHGVALKGKAKQQMLPGSTDWRIVARLYGHLRRRGIDRVEAKIDAAEQALPRTHHIGGHPVFAQWDFRKPGHYDDFDRVLLRLTSDELLRWGDAGEAVFMIRHADLIARNFSTVAFYWDCT
jgi:uncharacterized protein YwqG